jgi:hypothetical protein
MRIVVSKRDAGFTEAVALLDWELDTELVARGRLLDSDATAIAEAEAWGRRAAGANDFGASETAELQ